MSTRIALALLVAGLLLAGCSYDSSGGGGSAPRNGSASASPGAGGAGSAAASEVKVGIKDFAFTPAELEIRKGTKVTWTNYDGAPHTATAGGKFDSGILQKGQGWSKVFEEAGEFEYICTLHPSMKGRIKVS